MGNAIGKFIVLEGLDGSGKTTLLGGLSKYMRQNGLKCRVEREPSNGILGRVAREATRKNISLREDTLALLFAADRLEHIEKDITPILNKGIHILCDRYFYSNMAYQSISAPIERIIEYNRVAFESLLPDLCVFIDVNPLECAKRISESRAKQDLYDAQGTLIRKNYFKAFALLKDISPVTVIDGNNDPDIVLAKLWEVVKPVVHIVQ